MAIGTVRNPSSTDYYRALRCGAVRCGFFPQHLAVRFGAVCCVKQSYGAIRCGILSVRWGAVRCSSVRVLSITKSYGVVRFSETAPNRTAPW